MTEGDYDHAIELLVTAENDMRKGEYDFAHIKLLKALTLLEVPAYAQEIEAIDYEAWDEFADIE